MKCKKCNEEHDGKYGSGNFCSRGCANSRIFSQASRDKKRMAAHRFSDSIAPENRKKGPRTQEALESFRTKVRAIRRQQYEAKSFEELGTEAKRRRVFEEQGFRCHSCKLSTWLGKQIKLELEHKDGNRQNNARENLEGLCPNCHSFTPTYKIGNNKATSDGRAYTDEEIVNALKNNSSGYMAIKALGMNPHGGNYVRIRNIIKKYKIKLKYSV